MWRDVRAGKFPAPIELGPNSIGFYTDELDQWIETRPRRLYGAKQPEPPDRAT
jgi:predicted DNA-binding transcriptional regulator AlpA